MTSAYANSEEILPRSNAAAAAGQGDRLLVTRPFLPPREQYERYLDEAWNVNWLTNDGALSCRLEAEIAQWLAIDTLKLVSSGTSALQLALAALDVAGTVIVPAYSHIATANAPLLNNCRVKMVDVDPDSFCIDPEKVEAAIDSDVTAIMATHVYGLPCDVVALEDIARRRGLRLIYDGAHAFGARLRNRALLDYGDAAGVSFHATKPFHCVEGGGIVTHDPAHAEKISLMRGHGLRGDDIVLAGTNARMSEFHSAMGLAVLPHVKAMIAQRQHRFEAYRDQLEVLPVRLIEPEAIEDFTWNYAYFPVIFETEQAAVAVRHALAEDGIEGRRYFWPSLSRLDHIEAPACPIAEDLASRVLCLPFGQWITQAQIDRVSMIVINTLTG